MALRSSLLQALAAVAVTMTIFVAGCHEAPSPTSGAVFLGRLPDDVTFQPFKDTSAANVAADATTCYPGNATYCPETGASLKVTVPGPGNPKNVFAGGAFVAGLSRNLTGYDAVTFWAKASRPASFVVGLGSDNSGTSLYPAEWNAGLSTTWTRYVLPIPSPLRLTSERGLLYFAAGADGSPATGFTFWLNGIEYVRLGSALAGPAPALAPACLKARLGDGPFPAFPGTAPDKIPVGFTVNATSLFTSASRRYFDFASSDPTVATVDVAGVVTIQGRGSATVTARIAGIDAAGPLSLLVDTTTPCPAPAAPTDIAPAPTLPASQAISLFSSTYTNQRVDSWRTSWSVCCNELVDPYVISGHNVKKYTLHTFAGIEFIGAGGINEIDASKMTYFHLDLWTPDAFALGVRLVNDPGGFQSESTVSLNLGSVPTFQRGQWVQVEIPMTAFRNLGGTSKLGQMLFLVPDGTTGVVYVDNIYFHN